MSNIKQLVKKMAGNQLDKLLRFKSFQTYINDRYNKNGYMNINERLLENAYYSYKGFDFNINDQTDTIFDVFEHYDSSDIKPDDIVLDIGANVGGFTMLAAKKAQHVYSVEPLFHNIIRKNLVKNNINNVDVLEIGLGKDTLKIRYGKLYKAVKCYLLPEIINFCGGHVDFLKIDCEGGEWNIQPQELDGIRRIEGEIHNIDGKHDVDNFINMLEVEGFVCKTEKLSDVIILIHCKRK